MSFSRLLCASTSSSFSTSSSSSSSLCHSCVSSPHWDLGTDPSVVRLKWSLISHSGLSLGSRNDYGRNCGRTGTKRLTCCVFENVLSTMSTTSIGLLKSTGLSPFQIADSSQKKISDRFHRNVIYFLKKRNSRSRKKRRISSETSNLGRNDHSNESKWKEFLLGAHAGEASWNIPWEPFTIFQVMFLWFISFTIVGSYIMPSILSFLQISHSSLSYRHQAIYSLITDTCELFVGVGILNRCLASFKPLPKELFYFHWKGFWLFEILTAISAFPLVCVLSKVNLFLLPVKMNLNAKVPIEQNLNLNDPIATFLYSIVVIVCAPVWEEIIFRGFLLPSLTKYLPVSSSLILSSACFALAHFSVQRFLPLFFLGIVIGMVYLRSRNLFSSMLLHGMWNGYVFIQLLR